MQTGIQDPGVPGDTEKAEQVLPYTKFLLPSKQKKAELAVSYSSLRKEATSEEALHNSSDNQQGKNRQDPPPAVQQGDDAGAPSIVDPTSNALVGLPDYTPAEVAVGQTVNSIDDDYVIINVHAEESGT